MATTDIGRDEITRLFGNIEDHKIMEILAARPSHSDLEAAAAWVGEEDDVMGELRRPLTGTAARIYEIVGREPDETDEDSARR